jgi:hypothetical protein
MKVLVLAGEGAIQQVRIGYANALGHIGFQCLVWHPNSGKPIFDVFYEFEPDIVFCGTWELTRPLVKNLLQRPDIKLILWGSNWGSFDKEIDKEDTVLMAKPDEIKAVESITKKLSVKQIFSYYSHSWTGATHGYWRNVGLEPYGLPLAADLITYGVSQPREELKCDVSYIGGYWPYKAINLNKYLIPLCYPAEKLNVKIFGWGNWPVAQHLGMIDTTLLPNLFTSSTVNINIFEPLAQKYGFDVNERCYKVIACGGFCISEYCDSAFRQIFNNNEVIFATSPQDLMNQVKYFVAHPEKRLPYIQNGVRTSKQKHNYFHRLHDLLTIIGMNNGKYMNSLNRTIQELQSD